MKRVRLPCPISAGVILSYRCTSRCKHCIYFCSPFWKDNWMEEDLLFETLEILSRMVKRSPLLSFNYGIHFSGGEPFLNFDLLVEAVYKAKKLNFSPILVETNAMWCIKKDEALSKLKKLKEAGLDGILISVNPFLVEHVSFKRTKLAVECASEIFPNGVLIYQTIFYHEFIKQGLEGTLSLEEFLKKASYTLAYAKILPMGRACYELSFLFKKYPPQAFFGKNCSLELLSPIHVHVDNYGNYITGFCAGISWGHITELPIYTKEGVDLNNKPILRALLTDIKELYHLAQEDFGYQPSEQGYVSKCHLCLEIRKFLVEKNANFQELAPLDYYKFL